MYIIIFRIFKKLNRNVSKFNFTKICLFIHYHHPSVHPSIHYIHHHPSVHPSIHPSSSLPPGHANANNNAIRARRACVAAAALERLVLSWAFLSGALDATTKLSFRLSLSLSLSLSFHLLLFLSLASWHYTNFVTFFTFDSSFLSY